MDRLTHLNRIINGVSGALALAVPDGEQVTALIYYAFIASYGCASEVCLIVRPEDHQLNAVRAGEILGDGIDAFGPSRDDHVRVCEVVLDNACDVDLLDCPAANDSEFKFHYSVFWWFDLLITLQISAKIPTLQRKKREKSSKTKIKIGENQDKSQNRTFYRPFGTQNAIFGTQKRI